MTTTQQENYVSNILYEALYDKQNNRWKRDLDELNRTFGTPFRFTNATDYRPFAKETLSNGYNLDYGRGFLNNILSEPPILQIVPGLADYMPGVNSNERSYLENYIKAMNNDETVSQVVIDKILGTDARYYNFVPAYSTYIRYVNLLCRTCAVYMGLDGKTVPGFSTTDKSKYYENFNWGDWSFSTYTKNKDWNDDSADDPSLWNRLKSFVETTVKDTIYNQNKYIKFYVEPGVGYSEGISNNTTQSQFASLFDNVKVAVREAQFLTGGRTSSASGLLNEMLGGSENNGIVGVLGNALEGMGELLGVGVSNLIGQGAHILSGSNVVFPEIWSDSSYDRSYDFTVTLVSPYGDRESIFLNIIVPMMHLIAMSYPKQTSANSFASPFLVKVFAPGWFVSDLAMISSIRIEKGGDGAWSIEGFPLEVKISINVRDLYQAMSIPPANKPSLFLSNSSLIEYLAVTCGVDIAEPQLETKLRAIATKYMGVIGDIPDNIKNSIQEAIQNSGFAKLFKIGGF